jgi:glutathione S-transferase
MQLIGMLDSPYVRRVAIALIIAKTPFIHRPISLFRHIDQFSKLNPLLKAPTLYLRMTGWRWWIQAWFSIISQAPIRASPRWRRRGRLSGYWRCGQPPLPWPSWKKRCSATTSACCAAEKQHGPWVDRVTGQLTAGLSALDVELPGSAWIAGELGLADITVACAFGFTRSLLADVIDTRRYPNLGAFSARAEALSAFRAAPAVDATTVSTTGDWRRAAANEMRPAWDAGNAAHIRNVVLAM